jgi:glycosyltransferase involved in cell wall biosynthesis
MYGGVMADLVTLSVKDRPTVVTFHGSDLLGQPYERPVRKAVAQYGVFSSRRAARRCSSIVVVAKSLCSALPPNIENSKVRIIPCGIDLDLFRPLNRETCCQRLGWQLDRFHVLFQNTGDAVKRPLLARAAIDCVKRLGTNAELHELKGVPYTEVPTWLNGSDALLVTSIHEGSPTIVKEALACDLPIVSVDVGDVGERINGIAGCYLAAPEPEDLACKLRLIALRMERISGHSSVQDLSYEKIAFDLEHFYCETLKRHRGTTTHPRSRSLARDSERFRN